jgi:hypothetical protein
VVALPLPGAPKLLPRSGTRGFVSLVGAETLSRGREPEGSFPWSGAPRGTLWRFGGRNAVPWKLPRCYLAIRDPKVASRDLAPLDALSRFGTRRSVVAVGHPVGSPVVRRNRRLSMRRCRVSEAQVGFPPGVSSIIAGPASPSPAQQAPLVEFICRTASYETRN